MGADGNLYNWRPVTRWTAPQPRAHRARGALEGDATFQNVWRNVNVSRPLWWLQMHIN